MLKVKTAQLESTQIKHVPYPKRLSKAVLEKFASISLDELRGEGGWGWKTTPFLKIDLSSLGYGIIHVKDEAANIGMSIKDRMVLENALLHKLFGISAISQNGKLKNLNVPRLSIISAGDILRSFSWMFARFGLPPLKVLVDSNTPKEKLEDMKTMYADIYLTDLSVASLKPEQINVLTGNGKGIDLTSNTGFRPQEVFYDWFSREVFNLKPDEVYLGFGSGRGFENLIFNQMRVIRSDIEGTADKRVEASLSEMLKISILGAEPELKNSKADKLTKSFNPFSILKDHDITAQTDMRLTGKDTGVYGVREEFIEEAYNILSQHCKTGYSGSAGLALYLQRYEKQKPDPSKKAVIVNTGVDL